MCIYVHFVHVTCEHRTHKKTRRVFTWFNVCCVLCVLCVCCVRERAFVAVAVAVRGACARVAGDIMENDEMAMLINRLFSTEHPYYCPHGRPIIFQLSLEELDKRFERI